MTHRIGKTTPERLRFVGEWNAQKLRVGRLPVRTLADMGETVSHEFDVQATLKQRIRGCANERREHRTPENNALMNSLCLEAREKGWSVPEIARAAMCGRDTIHDRFRRMADPPQ